MAQADFTALDSGVGFVGLRQAVVQAAFIDATQQAQGRTQLVLSVQHGCLLDTPVHLGRAVEVHRVVEHLAPVSRQVAVQPRRQAPAPGSGIVERGEVERRKIPVAVVLRVNVQFEPLQAVTLVELHSQGGDAVDVRAAVGAQQGRRVRAVGQPEDVAVVFKALTDAQLQRLRFISGLNQAQCLRRGWRQRLRLGCAGSQCAKRQEAELMRASFVKYGHKALSLLVSKPRCP